MSSVGDDGDFDPHADAVKEAMTKTIGIQRRGRGLTDTEQARIQLTCHAQARLNRGELRFACTLRDDTLQDCFAALRAHCVIF